MAPPAYDPPAWPSSASTCAAAQWPPVIDWRSLGLHLLVTIDLVLVTSTIESLLRTLKPVVLDVATILVAHALEAGQAVVAAIISTAAVVLVIASVHGECRGVLVGLLVKFESHIIQKRMDFMHAKSHIMKAWVVATK